MPHKKFFPAGTENAMELYLNAQNKAYINIFKKENEGDSNCIVLGIEEIDELLAVLIEISRSMEIHGR